MTTKVLLACGAIAGPLFTAAWAAEGATRPHYNPLRHPVSSLELGEFGWTQRVNFIVAGLLALAFAIGLGRALRPLGGSTWGPLLVAGYAIGLVGAGVFVTDPVSGYPPGTPDHLQSYSSVHAALHDLLSLPTFVGLPIACLVLARRFAGWGQRGWAIYSAATGVGFALVGPHLTNRELIGEHANRGAEWQPVGTPVAVKVHDFPEPALGKAIPYGEVEGADPTGSRWPRYKRSDDATAAFCLLGQVDPDSDSLMGVGVATAGNGRGWMGRTVP